MLFFILELELSPSKPNHKQKYNNHYLLSAVEYAMSDCFMMLENVLNELPRLSGVICFSIFMLPENNFARRRIFDRIVGNGRSLHGALEDMSITDNDDIARLEDIWLIRKDLSNCPKRI